MLNAAPVIATRNDHVPRVLIVDDSAVIRAVLMRTIADDGRFLVVGAVSTAKAALAFLDQHRVDIVLLDLEMPGADGLSALPALLGASGDARVLIVSSACAKGGRAAAQALALGAADTLSKPEGGASLTRFTDSLIEKLVQLAEPPTVQAPGIGRADATLPVRGGPFDIVAVGASTGGIHALGAMLREIPMEMCAPILVTQHLPMSFSPYFAAQLALMGNRACDVATDRMRITPGRIVVAPGDAHMVCVPTGGGASAIRLSREPVASGCLPSVDPMFASVAAVHGERALGIVLSGMGRDGSEGARDIHAAGGGVVVQDRESSVVWGMPGAAFAANVVDAVLPPAEIGRLVATGCKPR